MRRPQKKQKTLRLLWVPREYASQSLNCERKGVYKEAGEAGV